MFSRSWRWATLWRTCCGWIKGLRKRKRSHLFRCRRLVYFFVPVYFNQGNTIHHLIIYSVFKQNILPRCSSWEGAEGWCCLPVGKRQSQGQCTVQEGTVALLAWALQAPARNKRLWWRVAICCHLADDGFDVSSLSSYYSYVLLWVCLSLQFRGHIFWCSALNGLSIWWCTDD